MSRIGKNPIKIPSGVTVEKKENTIHVKGPKGELTASFHPLIKIEIADGSITCSRTSESKLAKSLHGLTRTLLFNMTEGVTKGFEKKLEIVGVGYRATVSGSKIVFSLGHSHPIDFPIPKGIKIDLDKEKKNIIIISGIDKQLIGETAAKIRALRKPEPYKGKGIKYLGEHIARKAGKAAAAAKEK
jgi:large subunit ribosomal protein L6